LSRRAEPSEIRNVSTGLVDGESRNGSDYLRGCNDQGATQVPIVTPEKYREMLDAARAGQYALPAINTTSSSAIIAALEGFSEASSDGIIQVSYGAGEFASGPSNKDMALGARALAEFAHVVAERYPVNIALHTDHCPPDRVDGFIRPLLATSAETVAQGRGPLFQSHMLDASTLPMEENLALAAELLEKCAALGIILELEIGIVGGVEDATDHSDVDRSKLYTSPDDMVRVSEVLGTFDRGYYLLAAVFGNVHGVYKPGSVMLEPTILREGQSAVAARFDDDARHYLVFHGGSGSTLEEIHETLGYGVIKMNIDTDCQYAYTRPIVDHMLTGYQGVLKVDGEVGDKKVYDPRSYLKKAEVGMARRVVEACDMLKSAGNTIG
jgi:fructose-bisphosphate aldolase, class II